MSGPAVIVGGDTAASFAERGAELVGLRHRGRDRLWHGDPTWWSFRAPILFPVIGRSPQEQIRVGGTPYPMTSHGFARDRAFRAIESLPNRAVFELLDDAATRAMFPFEFRLKVAATVADGRLEIAATIDNRGEAAMPFCFGYHPAFLWPSPVAPRGAHVCRFEAAEDATIRRADLATGLLQTTAHPSPLQDRVLALPDSLFEAGSIQFEAVRSRRIWFGRPGEPGIDVAFPDSPQLGIWTKPGAPFLCIEPWQGLAETEAGDGELAGRPGVRVLAGGQSATYRLLVRLDVPDPAGDDPAGEDPVGEDPAG